MKRWPIIVGLVCAGVLALYVGWVVWLNFRGSGAAFGPPAGNIVDLIGTSTSTRPSSSTPATSTAPTQPGTNDTSFPLHLPPGFSIRIFAKGLGDPRVLAMDPRGTLVASLTSQGEIVALSDDHNQGTANQTVVILNHLNQPHGLAFRCDGGACQLYVAETDGVSVYRYDAVTRTATGRQKLFDLPGGGEHFTRTLQFLPDGRLLVAIGSDCNVCHESDVRRASVQVWDGKTLKPYTTGQRNSVFMTQRPGTDEIWATEMGRDYLGDDLPPDEINVLQEGKNYGWPICYGQNVHDTNFDKNTYIRNPCMEPFEVGSRVDLQAHSAPLGLAFVPADANWPADWKGDLIVAFHGSWNRSVPTGYKLVHIKLSSDGQPTGIEDFITGWLTSQGALGRPTGLFMDKDGTLYVADDKAGVVYAVTPPTH